MAEVATKKSINVVSNKKSEVCGVQSNNGLIDLDDLTASNNQLITLCDDDEDDLVLANNTRNELGGDDKSLQELIESELALRICSSKSDEDDEAAEAEEPEGIASQPETIKRIVLDRRQDPVDINAEFIAAESEHYSLIEEPSYGHRNGHTSPDADADGAKPEPVRFRDEQEEQVFVEQPEVGAAPIIVQRACDDERASTHDGEPISGGGDDDSEDCRAIAKDAALPTDETDSSDLLADETSCPEDKYRDEEEPVRRNDADQIDIVEEGKRASVAPDTWREQGPQAAQLSNDLNETICRPEESLEERKSPDEQVSTPPGDPSSSRAIEEDSQSIQEQLEMETASTQEFLDTERQVLSEETDRETPQIVVSSEVGEPRTISESISENGSAEFGKEDAQNPVDESSSELSASDSTFIEKTEVVVSDTGVTIYSETRQVTERVENLDSWTTVEEATRPADAEDAPAKRAGDTDDNEDKPDELFAPPSPRAPLATPDETETSDVSNACDVSVLFFPPVN